MRPETFQDFYSWACFGTCFKSFMHVVELLISSCLAAVWLLWSSLSSCDEIGWNLQVTAKNQSYCFHSRAFKQKNKEKWKSTIGCSDPFDPLFHRRMRLVGAYRSLSFKCDITRKCIYFSHEHMRHETFQDFFLFVSLFCYMFQEFYACCRAASSCFCIFDPLFHLCDEIGWNLQVTAKNQGYFFTLGLSKQKHKEKWKLAIGYSDPFDPLFHRRMRLVGAYRSLSSKCDITRKSIYFNH